MVEDLVVGTDECVMSTAICLLVWEAWCFHFVFGRFHHVTTESIILKRKAISSAICTFSSPIARLRACWERKRSQSVKKAKGYQKSTRQEHKSCEDSTTCAADIVEFLDDDEKATGQRGRHHRHKSTLTIPVSADRCWDWKNTASFSPQLGQSLLARGSCCQ